MQTSMRAANERGFECLLVADPTQSCFEAFEQATRAIFRAQGAIVGWTAPLSALGSALDSWK